MAAINTFDLFLSQDDSSYVAIHAEDGSGQPINVRIAGIALDDMDPFGGSPTPEQRKAFVRHNLDVFREIAQAKSDRGDFAPEDWHGREALAVWIRGPDIQQHLAAAHITLSYVAFNSKGQNIFVGRDGKFG